MLSDRLNAIKPSATLAVTTRARELRAEGKDVIGLGAGEPDFDTPEHIKQAAVDALAAGDTKYTDVAGTPAFKQAIIDKFKRDNRLDYEPGQVIVSCGAKHSLFNLFQTVLNPGDEVVIPAPYWVSYPAIALLAGAVPVFVEAGIDQGFRITPEQLDAAITDKSRLLILNSPSNPTGVAYSREQLRALGNVLERYPNLLIASDDIYEHIMWTDQPFANVVNTNPDLFERTILINGVSKAYSMTGWRIGYAAGATQIIAGMKKIQSQSTSNPTSIAQAASVAALNGDQSNIPLMVSEFRKRHDIVVDRLNQLPGVEAIESDGTFYTFPSFAGAIAARSGIENDIQLAADILENAGIAMVPGSAFGAEGYIRISYATDMETLETALDRLQDYLTS